MSIPFTPQAREAMALAEEEARRLRHTFVGTEHILLGLMRESSGAAAATLKTFGIEIDSIRLEVERLVSAGPEPVTIQAIPQTPRAKRAIVLAAGTASNLMQNPIGPEHLLVGLLREGEGVAAKVLANLGLAPESLVRETLKIRIQQIKLVERVVRPIPASLARKRKMREELLAHLTAIYERELARRKDPAQATLEAERRFGEPAELTREFERALPAGEYWHYRLEHLFGWRAPERATKWMLRLALQMFLIVAPFCGLMVAAELARLGWNRAALYSLRPAMAILFVLPLSLFVLGDLYFRMRDAIFGVFGARKSRAAVLLWTTLFAVAVFVTGITIGLLNDAATAINLLGVNLIAAPLVAMSYALYARLRGPAEIRDAIWSTLQIKD